jgi:predicted ATP-dependent Lon-type protease
MDVAVDLRQRVVDQLAVIAPSEFAGIKLDYLVREAVSAPEDTENVNA